MVHSNSRHPLRPSFAGVGIAAVLAVCAATPALAQVATLGSPAPEPETSSAPTEVLSEQDAMLAYAQCLRDNGVEVTDPIFDAGGGMTGGLEFAGGKDAGPKDEKDPSFQLATEACDEFLVAFKPAADPALAAEQTEAALRFAVCMREQGLDWPDPAPEGTDFAGADIKVDKESPEFMAAFEVCDAQLAVDAAGAAE
jgi:hypothetical protein